MKKETQENKETKKARPSEYRMGNIKLVEWKNTNKDGEKYFSYNIVKFYKDGEEWKETSSFGDRDLNLLFDLLLQLKIEKFPIIFKEGD